MNMIKEFTRNDRQKHLLIGMLLGFISVILAIAGGLYKEIIDQLDYGGFDWYDLLATIIGGICGNTISLLLYFLIF
ncbi:MAG: hypothetical protein MJ209_00140 [archaeon]|nr:hypothetical protein [archaeon]